jgi:hypothetical protein
MKDFPENWSTGMKFPSVICGLINKAPDSKVVNYEVCPCCFGVGWEVKSILLGDVLLSTFYFDLLQEIGDALWLPCRGGESIWFMSPCGIEGRVMGIEKSSQ